MIACRMCAHVSTTIVKCHSHAHDNRFPEAIFGSWRLKSQPCTACVCVCCYYKQVLVKVHTVWRDTHRVCCGWLSLYLISPSWQRSVSIFFFFIISFRVVRGLTLDLSLWIIPLVTSSHGEASGMITACSCRPRTVRFLAQDRMPTLFIVLVGTSKTASVTSPMIFRRCILAVQTPRR